LCATRSHPKTAASLTDVPNVRQQGTRIRNCLNRPQAKELLTVPDRERLIGKRDHAILALLLGCGLRRQELAQLKVEDIVEREGRSVIVDLVGKGRRVRTVAVPFWVKQSVEQWIAAAGITKRPLLRPVSKSGKLGETAPSRSATHRPCRMQGRVRDAHSLEAI
jgi:integrase